MDNVFFEHLNSVPMSKITTKAINADSIITEDDKKKLLIISDLFLETYNEVERENKNEDTDLKFKKEKILKIIDKCYKEQCKIMKELLDKTKNIPTKYEGIKRSGTIPILYRKVIFFITYSLYHLTKIADGDVRGIQNKVMNSLGLGHKTFGDWVIKPIESYEEGNYEGKVPVIQRFGRKNELLLFMFTSIISHVKYVNFVDVFGGTGAVTASKYLRNGTREYINDYDKLVANFLGALKFKGEELEEYCKAIDEEIEQQPDEDVLKEGEEEYRKRIERKEDKQTEAGDYADFDLFDKIQEKIDALYGDSNRNKLEYGLGLYKKYKKELDENKINLKNDLITAKDVDVEMASKYYYINNCIYKGNTSITGVIWNNINKFKESFPLIQPYAERLKKVEIRCEDFGNIINEFNNEETLLYVDSPYYRTTQYNVYFSDDDHIALHESLKNFKGNWVFSCRKKLPKNVTKPKKKDIRIDSLLEYFEMYSDIGKYVVYNENDENKEIMITNFDFPTPKIKTFKTLKGSKKNANKIEECFVKKTYSEFLNEMKSMEFFKNLKLSIRDK